MASGLTDSTAAHAEAGCSGYLEDTWGLRPGGRCSFMPRPSFGAVAINWAARTATLSVRAADGSGVAIGPDAGALEVRISLDTCLRV